MKVHVKDTLIAGCFFLKLDQGNVSVDEWFFLCDKVFCNGFVILKIENIFVIKRAYPVKDTLFIDIEIWGLLDVRDKKKAIYDVVNK